MIEYMYGQPFSCLGEEVCFSAEAEDFEDVRWNWSNVIMSERIWDGKSEQVRPSSCHSEQMFWTQMASAPPAPGAFCAADGVWTVQEVTVKKTMRCLDLAAYHAQWIPLSHGSSQGFLGRLFVCPWFLFCFLWEPLEPLIYQL